MISSKKNVAVILLCTFILMALMVTYTTRVIYRTAFRSVEELGVDKTTAITAELENYLETARSVLWVAADTVDHMVANGATYEEIVDYILFAKEKGCSMQGPEDGTLERLNVLV